MIAVAGGEVDVVCHFVEKEDDADGDVGDVGG